MGEGERSGLSAEEMGITQPEKAALELRHPVEPSSSHNNPQNGFQRWRRSAALALGLLAPVAAPAHGADRQLPQPEARRELNQNVERRFKLCDGADQLAITAEQARVLE